MVPTAHGDVRQVEVEDLATGRSFRAGVGVHIIIQVDSAGPEATLRSWGLVPVRPLMPSRGLWLARDAAGLDALDGAGRLRPAVASGALRLAAPDLFLRRRFHTVTIPPNDPRYGGQWYLERIGMEEAWALTTGSPSTTVVVVDNGCDTDHPDLRDKMDPGRDVVDGDDDPSPVPGAPGNNHGTACAGIVAATTDNGLGVAGTCPECRLRCVRLLSDSGAGTPISADVEAFQFALDVGAAVVSNSWGFVGSVTVPTALAEAIEEVFDRGRGGLGAMVLFAAGNDDHEVGMDELQAVRGVIAVGAINVYDETTSFTNFGDPVDVVAPTGTLTTDIAGPDGADPGDYTALFGGTSSACPVAAGVAGLLVSAAPQETSATLSHLLVHHARQVPFASPNDAGHDPYFGYGVVAPARALRAALGLPEPVDGGPPRPDAAVVPDASPDAGPPGAAGDAPGDQDDSKRPGCLCAAPGHGPWWMLVLGVILVTRQRRR
jgi:MYXO-CTERM domain-containing protein